MCSEKHQHLSNSIKVTRSHQISSDVKRPLFSTSFLLPMKYSFRCPYIADSSGRVKILSRECVRCIGITYSLTYFSHTLLLKNEKFGKKQRFA